MSDPKIYWQVDNGYLISDQPDDEFSTPLVSKSAYDAVVKERDELKAELAKWTSEPIPIALMKCNQRNENYLDDIDTLRKQLVVAVEALKHGYVLDDGKAYIRSKGNVPMEMNAKSERIVRKALVAFFHLNGLLTHFASERHAEESTAQQTES